MVIASIEDIARFADKAEYRMSEDKDIR